MRRLWALLLVIGCDAAVTRAEAGAFAVPNLRAPAPDGPLSAVPAAPLPACTESPEGCVREAVELTRTDLPRAARLFEGACAAGSAAGCGNLAVMLRDGRGVPADPSRAQALARAACHAGNDRSCADL